MVAEHLGGGVGRRRDTSKGGGEGPREFATPHPSLTVNFTAGPYEVYCGLAYDPDDYGEGVPILVALQRHTRAQPNVPWAPPDIAFLRERVAKHDLVEREWHGQFHLPENNEEFVRALWYLP